MKNLITKNLVYFALSALALGILFRIGLSYSIENRLFAAIVAVAVLYAVAMFAAGWMFGKRDHIQLPVYDIGFRFHLCTYLIFFLVGYMWFLLGFNSPCENILVLHRTAICWGIVLLIHFFFYRYSRRKTINGLDKENLFE
jgi:hypothetical protein